jgi:hypothetical protein
MKKLNQRQRAIRNAKRIRARQAKSISKPNTIRITDWPNLDWTGVVCDVAIGGACGCADGRVPGQFAEVVFGSGRWYQSG